MLTFEWLDLPVGPQPLPDWLLDADVSWLEGYLGWPSVRIRTTVNAREWPGQTFTREGRTLIARHPDGRAHKWTFRGEIEEVDLTRWVDGKAERYRGLATPQTDGLGGSHVRCLMGDGPHAGEVVTIRGPWCTGPAPGYVEVAYVPPPTREADARLSWTNRCGIAGLDLSEDLFLRIVARFLPHCRVARIHGRSYAEIEVAHGSWDVPKTVAEDRRIIRRPLAGEVGR